MDAIDILGSLLGRKSGQSGKGSDVLKDIFKGGGSRSTPPPKRKTSQPPQRKTSAPPKASDIQREAKELEDLLNVANDRQTRRPSRNPTPSRPAPSPQRDSGFQREAHSGGHRQETSGMDGKALILVQAMVNAAKSDGQIDRAEQDSMLKQLQDPSPDAIQFLRQEFEKPLDVREFTASVPIGMEQQVYTMSLIAIDLDTGQEAKYLMALADGLRLPMEVREQIHERLGAPSIY